MLAAALDAGAATAQAARGKDHARLAYSIDLPDGDVLLPRTERELEQALDEAARKRAALAILRLDTRGGLLDSARRMAEDIIAAPLPVVVYVSPSGASATSGGLFLLLAGDVAAMAPETNTGSATPVWRWRKLPSDLRRKAVNDSAALARALTEDRGRNPRLADRMVRDGLNVTATSARRAGLLDVVAPSEQALLRRLDGMRVKGPKARRLHTAGLRIERWDATPEEEIPASSYAPPVNLLTWAALGLAGIGVMAGLVSSLRR